MNPSCSPELARALFRWFNGDTEPLQPRKAGGYLKPDTVRLLSMKDTYATGVRNNRLFRVLRLKVEKNPDLLLKTAHFSSASLNRFSSFTQRLDLAEEFYLTGGPSQGNHGVIVSVDLRVYAESPVIFSWTSALLATRSYPAIRQKILSSGKALKEFVLFFEEAPLLRIEKILPPI